jgi:PAS domain S-box-containing protein
MAQRYTIKDKDWSPKDEKDILYYRNVAARLEAIVDSQPDCVKIVTRDYKLMEMNVTGLKMIDVEHIDEIRGSSILGIVDPEYQEAYKKSIDDAYEGKNTNVEFTITGLKGSKRRMSQHTAPIYDSEDPNKIIETVAVSRDITEQYDTMVALGDAKKMAEQASKVKSNFLATMSHEFRTPLNAIIGFSEIIKAEIFGKIGNAKYAEYMEDIYNSGRHLLDLINDVLDISEIEADKRIIIKEDLDLGDLIAHSIATVKVLAEQNNVELIAEIEEGLPLLNADNGSVKRILFNLLSNAIKFSSMGGDVIVKTYQKEDNIMLSVSDQGIGIPEEALDNLTNPFYRVQEEAIIASSGTGLGLSIVKSLVEAHQGELKIKSKVPIGTTVMVSFPLSNE